MSLALQVGDRVAGKYRVDRILGEGGMGVVVAATHEQLEQPVALKFLLPDLMSNEEIVRRFLREARAAVKIQSEHVARVLDVGKTDAGMPYMVMEYLDGEDLSQVLKARGVLPVDETVGFVLQACEAIAEAHSLGIVHRDLKPANLFLARRPSGKPIVKVLDFGISKVPQTTRDSRATSTSSLMGSPSYMSPEQMTAPTTVDPRTDIWSLGVVLYEMLSKKLPFEGDTMPALVFTVVEKPHTPLQSLRPELPEGLIRVVDCCLQKKQDERFASVAQLARALAAYAPPRSEQSVERIEHLLGVVVDGAAATPERPRAVFMPPSADALTLLPTTSLPATPRRRRVMMPVALTVIGALGFFLLLLWLGSRHPGVSTAAPTEGAALSLASPAAAAPTATVTPSASASTTVVIAPPPAESTATPPPSATSTVPWAGKPVPGGRAASHSTPSGSLSTATPACRIVTSFDADGNKHFKKECR